MKVKETLVILAALSAGQWGLFTTKQAGIRGISRLALSRLADAGIIERVRHGVYRDAGAAPDEFEPLRAVWLASAPMLEASERLSGQPDVVVSGATAAELHGIGDVRADKFEFTVSRRRQSQQPDVHFRLRKLDHFEVTLRHGLPVTTVERTIADLTEAQADLTHVAVALGDALRRGSVDLERLASMLAPAAVHSGMSKGDGQALVDHLLKLAGMDVSSTAARLAAVDVLAVPVVIQYLRNLAQQAEQIKHQSGTFKIDTPTIDAISKFALALESSLQPQRVALSRLHFEPTAIWDQWRRRTDTIDALVAQADAIAAISKEYSAKSLATRAVTTTGDVT